MKYSLQIEGRSLVELIKNIEEELVVVRQNAEEALRHDKLMSTKIVPENRKHKAWEDFEINFIVENYQSKKIKWIASALNRPVTSISQKLFQLYKLYPNLKKKNNKASKAIIKKL